MSKFFGEVAYATQIEIPEGSGVWVDHILEKIYTGDMFKDMSRVQQGETLNDNLVIDNKLSIVADAFAFENSHHIRYINWMGIKWKIKSIEVQRPRLIMYMGGVYNEQTSGITSEVTRND